MVLRGILPLSVLLSVIGSLARTSLFFSDGFFLKAISGGSGSIHNLRRFLTDCWKELHKSEELREIFSQYFVENTSLLAVSLIGLFLSFLALSE